MVEMTHKVLITDYTWPNIDAETAILNAAGIEVIVAPNSEVTTLRDLAVDVDAIMFCFAAVPDEAIRAATKCKVASRFGIGVDNINRALCTELGIVVTNVPDYSLEEVADHVMANILTFNRHLIPLNRSVRETGWGSMGLPMHSRRLSTTTLGIVGMGRIGRTLVTRARAFGMRVLASDPLLTEDNKPDGVQVSDLPTLLAESDFVTLHTPLIPQTTGLIGKAELAAMKSTAFLVNAARGPLIDDDALVSALRSGEIAGVALDVTPVEPLPADHPLTTMDNVIMTPHTAFHSLESLNELEVRTAREVVRVLDRQMPENLVNPEVLGSNRAGLT
ncbi:MAG: C-terminal binding protein [Chloroflexi bacterium]|nr:C-terminal binding protein [Chloroflexota bacterium]